MRKILCVLLIVSFFHFVMPEWSAAADLSECRLMRDPVDPDGIIDWNQECILTLQEEVAVTMNSNSGSWVRCRLQPGVAVVMDTETGDWLRIRACSNEFPQGFSPDVAGTLDCMSRAVTKTRQVLVFSPPPELPPIPPAPPQITVKKKKKAWPWIVAGVLIAGIAVAASSGGGDSAGGPAPDPPH